MSLQHDLIQKNEAIAAKQLNLRDLLQGVTELSGQPALDRRDAIKTANDELTALAKERDSVQDLVNIESRNSEAIKAMRQPAGRQVVPDNDDTGDPSEGPAMKTLRDVLRESSGYQAAIKSGNGGKFRGVLGEVAYKTLITTANGALGEPQRVPLVSYAVEDRTVADLMLQGTTTAPSIQYYEETTFTNAAAEVTEGSGAKAESALAFTLRTEPIQTIATWIPVTQQMLEDGQQFEDYLRERLAFMVKRREEAQLLVGDGTAPNISGITDRSTIQTQAKGADPTPDAVYKAMTKIRTIGFAEPTAVVFHPNDWQDIRLLRTADGIYIWGSPADAGPERIWGLEVRQTTAMTENTALVGAFKPHAQVWRRTGIEIAVSDSHSDYFIYNKLAVRAEERLALAVYRPAAFATVTGI